MVKSSRMAEGGGESDRKPEKVGSDTSAQHYGLLPTLSDLAERMKTLQIIGMEENEAGDTFAQRAEWFYERRPMLLSLLQDLYTGYTTLLDRSNRNHNPKHHNTTHHDQEEEDEGESCNMDQRSEISCDVESTLSFQQMLGIGLMNAGSDHENGSSAKTEEVVLQLVTKSMENNMLWNELLERELQCQEASGIIDLLKKVVELLEMEKDTAVQDNTRLGQKVRELLEENRDLAAEALFVKQEAVRLARCVLDMKDDHFNRVCLLQERIYRLQEMKNNHTANEKASACCFGLEKHRAVKKKKKDKATRTNKKGYKWLKRIKCINPFIGCDTKQVF